MLSVQEFEILIKTGFFADRFAENGCIISIGTGYTYKISGPLIDTVESWFDKEMSDPSFYRKVIPDNEIDELRRRKKKLNRSLRELLFELAKSDLISNLEKSDYNGAFSSCLLIFKAFGYTYSKSLFATNCMVIGRQDGVPGNGCNLTFSFYKTDLLDTHRLANASRAHVTWSGNENRLPEIDARLKKIFKEDITTVKSIIDGTDAPFPYAPNYIGNLCVDEENQWNPEVFEKEKNFLSLVCDTAKRYGYSVSISHSEKSDQLTFKKNFSHIHMISYSFDINCDEMWKKLYMVWKNLDFSTIKKQIKDFSADKETRKYLKDVSKHEENENRSFEKMEDDFLRLSNKYKRIFSGYYKYCERMWF